MRRFEIRGCVACSIDRFGHGLGPAKNVPGDKDRVLSPDSNFAIYGLPECRSCRSPRWPRIQPLRNPERCPAHRGPPPNGSGRDHRPDGLEQVTITAPKIPPASPPSSMISSSPITTSISAPRSPSHFRGCAPPRDAAQIRSQVLRSLEDEVPAPGSRQAQDHRRKGRGRPGAAEHRQDITSNWNRSRHHRPVGP